MSVNRRNEERAEQNARDRNEFERYREESRNKATVGEAATNAVVNDGDDGERAIDHKRSND